MGTDSGENVFERVGGMPKKNNAMVTWSVSKDICEQLGAFMPKRNMGHAKKNVNNGNRTFMPVIPHDLTLTHALTLTP